MSNRKLIIPEARKALEQYKLEMAKELGVSNQNNAIDSGYLAASHTGLITRKLVEMGEKQLMNKYNKK